MLALHIDRCDGCCHLFDRVSDASAGCAESVRPCPQSGVVSSGRELTLSGEACAHARVSREKSDRLNTDSTPCLSADCGPERVRRTVCMWTHKKRCRTAHSLTL